ncbi:MAG TPA: ANTAR domain-containing protein [Verrucomicrobiae bacterium]|nr:ANTAR domain-containing protein [Verrucomicrobiae bacterium]
MKSQRIVIVAPEMQIRAEIKQVASAVGYQVTGEASNPEEGLRLIRRVQPDLVLLDPAGRNLTLLDILSQEAEIPVVIVLGAQEQHLLERVVDAGAAGVVFKPLGVLELAPVLLVAMANFRNLAKLRQKIRQVEEDFEVRKLVDRAKGKLMGVGMGEDDAYRWLQKASMDTQRSLKRIAMDILKDRMELPDTAPGK